MSTPHKGSQETFEYIADWITPDFFHSKKDGWDRMGILAMLADCLVRATPGAIAEVGVGESSIYLSHVARKYGRNMYHCDIAPDKILNPLTVAGYLRPDVNDLRDPENFPKSNAFQLGNSYFYAGPSDVAFQLVKEPLALTFIDGDHHYEQAKVDFLNALQRTADNGYILLHDTYPPSEEYCNPDSACGDVYKLRHELEKRTDIDCLTIPRGCCMGVGLTICRKKPQTSPYYQDGSNG